MEREQAKQIAELLNNRNLLAIKYTEDKILVLQANFVLIEEKGFIVACAESKKVQWYQWEISHVSVDEKFAGKGYGSKILN